LISLIFFQKRGPGGLGGGRRGLILVLAGRGRGFGHEIQALENVHVVPQLGQVVLDLVGRIHDAHGGLFRYVDDLFQLPLGVLQLLAGVVQGAGGHLRGQFLHRDREPAGQAAHLVEQFLGQLLKKSVGRLSLALQRGRRRGRSLGRGLARGFARPGGFHQVRADLDEVNRFQGHDAEFADPQFKGDDGRGIVHRSPVVFASLEALRPDAPEHGQAQHIFPPPGPAAPHLGQQNHGGRIPRPGRAKIAFLVQAEAGQIQGQAQPPAGGLRRGAEPTQPGPPPDQAARLARAARLIRSQTEGRLGPRPQKGAQIHGFRRPRRAAPMTEEPPPLSAPPFGRPASPEAA